MDNVNEAQVFHLRIKHAYGVVYIKRFKNYLQFLCIWVFGPAKSQKYKKNNFFCPKCIIIMVRHPKKMVVCKI